VTLSGMQAPNSRNFGLRAPRACKRRGRWASLWLEGSLRLESTVRSPQARIVSFNSQLRSLGHGTLWSWPRAKVCKEEKRFKITSCRLKAHWMGQLGRWVVRPPPPPQQAFGTAPRRSAGGNLQTPTGVLWDGEIRTTARDNNLHPPRVPGDGQINMADQDTVTSK